MYIRLNKRQRLNVGTLAATLAAAGIGITTAILYIYLIYGFAMSLFI